MNEYLRNKKQVKRKEKVKSSLARIKSNQNWAAQLSPRQNPVPVFTFLYVRFRPFEQRLDACFLATWLSYTARRAHGEERGKHACAHPCSYHHMLPSLSLRQ